MSSIDTLLSGCIVVVGVVGVVVVVVEEFVVVVVELIDCPLALLVLPIDNLCGLCDDCPWWELGDALCGLNKPAIFGLWSGEPTGVDECECDDECVCDPVDGERLAWCLALY